MCVYVKAEVDVSLQMHVILKYVETIYIKNHSAKEIEMLFNQLDEM